ncbi:MAG: sulfatase-like hydrolase/transferase, partial [Tannerella sp.]|nr:sulfatase-like hydrolase/transferase [Tannerella sp.]
MKTENILLSLGVLGCLPACTGQRDGEGNGIPSKPLNVVFILSDDHRYDFMGFMNRVPWLQTPNMDRMAREGAHVRNAFVTTALSSPSRASILTGMYSHSHRVVDNSAPLP